MIEHQVGAGGVCVRCQSPPVVGDGGECRRVILTAGEVVFLRQFARTVFAYERTATENHRLFCQAAEAAGVQGLLQLLQVSPVKHAAYRWVLCENGGYPYFHLVNGVDHVATLAEPYREQGARGWVAKTSKGPTGTTLSGGWRLAESPLSPFAEAVCWLEVELGCTLPPVQEPK